MQQPFRISISRIVKRKKARAARYSTPVESEKKRKEMLSLEPNAKLRSCILNHTFFFLKSIGSFAQFENEAEFWIV